MPFNSFWHERTRKLCWLAFGNICFQKDAFFETRNPSPRNLLKVRHPQGDTYATPDGGHFVVTEQQHSDPMTQIQHYTRHLTFLHPGGQCEEKMLRVALRYVYPQDMEGLLYYNGLQIRACYGCWQHEPLKASSPSMIYVCQRRV